MKRQHRNRMQVGKLAAFCICGVLCIEMCWLAFRIVDEWCEAGVGSTKFIKQEKSQWERDIERASEERQNAHIPAMCVNCNNRRDGKKWKQFWNVISAKSSSVVEEFVMMRKRTMRQGTLASCLNVSKVSSVTHIWNAIRIQKNEVDVIFLFLSCHFLMFRYSFYHLLSPPLQIIWLSVLAVSLPL